MSTKTPLDKSATPWVLLIIAILIAWFYWPRDARGADELPACPADVEPPQIVVTPDGTEWAVTRYVYDPTARRTVLFGYARLFCDGYEGATP